MVHVDCVLMLLCLGPEEAGRCPDGWQLFPWRILSLDMPGVQFGTVSGEYVPRCDFVCLELLKYFANLDEIFPHDVTVIRLFILHSFC